VYNKVPNVFFSSCDPKLPELTTTSGPWQWHGNFNYAELDKSLAAYMTCIGQGPILRISISAVNF
jgi:hypothetical protein